MDPNLIKDSFDRVTKKQKLSAARSQEIVDQIIQEIGNAIDLVRSSNNGSCKTVVAELQKKLQEIAPLSQLESTQRELNIALSKYLKVIEKSFNPDISKAYRNVEFDMHAVNEIIASHFYQQGLFEIGDCFITETRESKTEIEVLRSHFFEMYQILEAMKNRDLQPALNWAMANSDKLGGYGSELILKLHCLQFVEILQKGNGIEALNYAKTKLTAFASNHIADIQKYINCLCWAGNLERSPYPHLLSTTNWEVAAEELTHQFCSILGQSCESPLSVTVAAGIQGLPPLLKFMTVVAGKKHDWKTMKQLPFGKKKEWQTMKQLPVPVELDREFQFHSIFVCPVSKEQASDENPPMLMTCGHVLCKQSINKISKNNSKTFKCPYCPSDIDASQCRPMFF
ncbi:hypothetical protein ACFE04_001254 [Oxalis oulophora]